MKLPKNIIKEQVARALAEDLGRAGDITSQAVIGDRATATADLVIRKGGVLAGLPLAIEAFQQVDEHLKLDVCAHDGQKMEKGAVALKVSGNATSILTAERVALNFVGHLSGIATATAAFVEKTHGTRASIACTRKTTPGLRALQKYAVRMGGGMNHRFGLDDAILIKDNHIAVVGSVDEAVKRARAAVGHLVKVEIEVETLDQLQQAIEARADVIMLDNMSLDEMKRAVSITRGRAILEASGSVTLETVSGIAETGVDVISTGWITHSAPNLDVALDIVIG